MEIVVKRFSHGKDDTLGLMFVDCEFECFTLEDEYREEKVMHETRIPEGRYEIKLRNAGGMNERYKRFDYHKGMLHLQEVPNFTYIYIHIGNREDQTSGCILVGDTCQSNVNGRAFVGNSKAAYERLYKKIVEAMEKEAVFITVENYTIQ